MLQAEKVALELIKDNVALIIRIADALLEKTELNAKELDLLLAAQAAACPENYSDHLRSCPRNPA